MFKSDGTAIRDPEKYVARLEEGQYRGDLVDAKGAVIKDPAAFLKGMRSTGGGHAGGGSRGGGDSWGGDGREASAKMYKLDGTAIRDPVAYVARLEKAEYQRDLLDERGEVIKDPAAYVASLRLPKKEAQKWGAQRQAPKLSSSAPSAPKAGPVQIGSALYTEDGNVVRDPMAYVAGMMRTGGAYEGGLFNENGEEIRDPVRYVNNMAFTGTGSWSPRTSAAGAESSPLYKADGSLIKDPVAYVAGMESKPGGYMGGLYNAKGEEIRDPVAYVRNMSGGTQKPRSASTSKSWSPGSASSDALYKADGTLVRDPVKYVEAMVRSGGYEGGLFNAKGEEIRDPLAYVKGMTEGYGYSQEPRKKRSTPY
mmetsp:Transcript_111123/g.313530  ORF Transcript_111123/g.313530 Transcript_111123/m.313530 type:complete len:366 (-) Transcript_111123:87-1184(-)